MGEEFDGLIIGATRYGAFVELTELFVEGLVPIDTLPGDRYTYHENVRRICGTADAPRIFGLWRQGAGCCSIKRGIRSREPEAAIFDCRTGGETEKEKGT